ncbi:PAS domain S-box protein [Aliinostoc sp. HNIBRCY26]|uniref:hybrid sensor histidine kinase/response regulator n=1 Tax=Aliinostoc sp. HNIBRCY26 TaxID=3418997 RepID=UPI003CFC70F4
MSVNSYQESALDITTVVQLSQAIAGELVLSDLLPNLIYIFMEHTEADVGFLVMEKGGEWVIEAAGQFQLGEISINSLLQSLPIANYLSQSIIHQVAKTQTSIVLNNVTPIDTFTTIANIQYHQSQSLLCVPLVNQGQLEGILYLEKQEDKPFSGYHLALIETLSGQTAIALAHAQLYTQIKERENQLAQILNALPIGVALHDTTGKIVYANSIAAQLAGDDGAREATIAEISQAYHLYRGSTEQLYPTDELPVVRALAGETLTIDDIVILQGNCAIALEVVSTPIYNEQGQTVYALCAMQDITERKQVEIALKESEERFRQLAENIDAIFWMRASDQFQILYISQAYTRIFGGSATQIFENPQSFFNFVHPEDLDKIKTVVVNSQDSFELEYRIVRPDGEIRWIRDRCFPIRDTKGKIYRYAGIAEDITQRKQADAKIHEQATLIDISTDAIFVQDLENRISFWNESAKCLYGWTAATVIGQNAIQLLFHPDETALLAKEIQPALTHQGAWQGELLQVTQDGRKITVASRWTLVRDDQGQPKSILVTNTDITEKKQIEQQFLRAQRLESIGTLASGIAHDLNNVLSPISMSLELLEKKLSDQQSRQLLKMLDSNVKRGAALIKQVLSFSRGVSGKRMIIQVKHIVSEIQHIIQQTFPKSIEFSTHIAPELWTISGDATQLNQVIMNLCINARDAMPNGGCLRILATNIFIDELSVQKYPEAEVGCYVMLAVTDTGMGIPPEILERMFEPFFTTKEIGKGTGLGLSTVIGITRSHAGFINVETTVGKGSQFQVYLPAVTGQQSQPPAAQDIPKGNGELILVVDDEQSIREMAKALLLNHNYRVLTANNGVDAIAIYIQHKTEINVVLVDMIMPDMDGITTIHTLQKINPTAKIIASSGLLSSDKLAEVASSGVQAFLPKPYTLPELLRTIYLVNSQ